MTPRPPAWQRFAGWFFTLSGALGAGLSATRMLAALEASQRDRFSHAIHGIAAARAAELDAAREGWLLVGATSLVALGVALLVFHARWFRWTGWLFALALSAASVLSFGAVTAGEVLRALMRCAAHPALHACSLEHDPGADPPTSPDRREWRVGVAASGAALCTASAFTGSLVLGGAWVASLIAHARRRRHLARRASTEGGSS